MKLVENVRGLAAKKGCTPGQLALAWVLARGDDVIPIPGTKRVNCFDENLAALKVSLTPVECADIESAVPHHEVIIIQSQQCVKIKQNADCIDLRLRLLGQRGIQNWIMP